MNDDVMNVEIYLQSASPAMANRRTKRGRAKYKKMNIHSS